MYSAGHQPVGCCCDVAPKMFFVGFWCISLAVSRTKIREKHMGRNSVVREKENWEIVRLIERSEKNWTGSRTFASFSSLPIISLPFPFSLPSLLCPLSLAIIVFSAPFVCPRQTLPWEICRRTPRHARVGTLMLIFDPLIS